MPADRPGADPEIRVCVVTLDSLLAGPAVEGAARLRAIYPGLSVSLHAAAEWGEEPEKLEKAKQAVAEAHIVVCGLLFLDDQVRAILPTLEAHRDRVDALIGVVSAPEITKLTRMGALDMQAPDSAVMKFMKRLRPSNKGPQKAGAGEKQMRVLRRLPKILRFIPGKAQDLRSYFLTMQYWLSGTGENVEAMLHYLVDAYADGERAVLRGRAKAPEPRLVPETGVYHPRLAGRITDDANLLPDPPSTPTGTVGLLLMRSYVLAEDTRHYDTVIEALEARGLRVIPAFAAGLDGRPPMDAFFKDEEGRTTIDAMVSLTGFSLVGGPAYNDSSAAEEALVELDVPYIAAHALEFQRLDQWQGSDRGLSPIENTMMVALPEIDGATGPMVFGGRLGEHGACEGCALGCVAALDNPRSMAPCPERIERLADRVAKLVALRRSERAERRVAVILYGFPPNAGAIGTAAYLSVFESLMHTLTAMKAQGYDVELPESVDALREAVLHGNAEQFGQDANVAAVIDTDAMVRGEPYLADLEESWGPAPGKIQADGRGVFVLGVRLGNIFIGVQPTFGYEGDPMRLLFEKSFAPTHAFNAFYRWIREDLKAHAVLHYGMHGALEFMPGKQTGLGYTCWPDRLIGDLPNVYLYAANNPSEGALAKRRSAATIVTYLTPPLAQAGLYKGLVELKSTLDRWRALPPGAPERAEMAELLQAQAAAVDLCEAEPAWEDADASALKLLRDLAEAEESWIPDGFHIVGGRRSAESLAETLAVMAEAQAIETDAATLQALAAAARAHADAPQGAFEAPAGAPGTLVEAALALANDTETGALLRALDARFIAPAPGGDIVRAPDVLPTGRNMHAFDPFRMPSAFALQDGAKQATKLIERHVADHGELPKSVALVLWGADNLKTEGGPIAQALHLLGARPRFDSYGRLAGAELIPLEDLGRPRIDVVVTLSGIFRDLLPIQTRMLAEAAWMAASAEGEGPDDNFVRAHALAYAEAQNCDLETAALRVFSNADGAYGANVNALVGSGAWDEEDELADAYEARKCFAYGRDGKPARQAALLQCMLQDVDLAYQNLESVELGVTTIDHYFDTLGGVSRAVKRAKGEEAAVYIGDATRGDGKVRTLKEQVALETRTRTLNPKWYEGLLRHGREGVREIEAHVTNALGWSATTGQVDPWVYQRISETYVLDEEMRRRLAELNPQASARLANRLLEAHDRAYWQPDDETLEALRRGAEELEDRLEGVFEDEPVDNAATSPVAAE
ncbi:MAG: magnesium chelatase subunit H [Pseudomonadota bacterium]